eukprot:792134_1
MSNSLTSNEPPSVAISNAHSTDTFTMVFLDFDDTLFPSRMYQLFANHLSIDIFELFSHSTILKLQHTIIECIDTLRKQMRHIVFSVVSNASQSWLDYMFNRSSGPRLAVLDKYFKDNDISIVSASAANAQASMWKYTAFASEIAAFCRKTGKRCDRIISIGDGDYEEKAVQRYTRIHKVHSVHVQCIKTPTIGQLIDEWTYLKCHLNVLRTHDLSQDNNMFCTGKMHQLPAIQQYFEYWMEHVVSSLNMKNKKKVMDNVCRCIHKRLYSLKARSVLSRHFKSILATVICSNHEFSQYFNAYYQTVEQHSKQLQKTMISK